MGRRMVTRANGISSGNQQSLGSACLGAGLGLGGRLGWVCRVGGPKFGQKKSASPTAPHGRGRRLGPSQGTSAPTDLPGGPAATFGFSAPEPAQGRGQACVDQGARAHRRGQRKIRQRKGPPTTSPRARAVVEGPRGRLSLSLSQPCLWSFPPSASLGPLSSPLCLSLRRRASLSRRPALPERNGSDPPHATPLAPRGVGCGAPRGRVTLSLSRRPPLGRLNPHARRGVVPFRAPTSCPLTPASSRKRRQRGGDPPRATPP